MLNEIVKDCVSPKWPEQYFQSHISFSKLGTLHQEEGLLFLLSSIYFLKFVYLRKRQRGRELKAGSAPSGQSPMWGLNP